MLTAISRSTDTITLENCLEVYKSWAHTHIMCNFTTSIEPTEICISIYQKTCTRIFITTLFVTAEKKPTQMPTTIEWENKLQYTHKITTGIYELQLHATIYGLSLQMWCGGKDANEYILHVSFI